MLYSKMVVAAALGVAIPAAALADTEETELDRIVVEGSKLGQTAAEVGSSVTVITRRDLDELGFDFALDAVALAPGVTINSNGPYGGVASVRIRGADSNQTLVLIDGVPVNDPSSPSGGFNFARLDTESIERVEILKGPQSTFWGTDAMGGVVSVITRRQQRPAGGSAFAGYGSFDTWRGGASFGHAHERGDFRVGVTRTRSAGISKADRADGNVEDDAYQSLVWSGRGGLMLPADIRLDAGVLRTDAEAEFDGRSRNAQGEWVFGDADELSKTSELAANVRLSVPAAGERLEHALFVGYSEIERENVSDGVGSFAAAGDRRSYRYQGTFALDTRNVLAFGAEREETSADGEEGSLDGAFAFYEAKPSPGLVLTAGLRSDDHARFGSETTARLAGSWHPTDALTLRASWGEGFKAPTLDQIAQPYRHFCGGDKGADAGPTPALQPSTSEAFDLGVEWRAPTGAIDVGATYFDQRTAGLINYNLDNCLFENLDAVQSRGVELYGSYRAASWLTISVNHAYIDARTGAGERLHRLPRHSADLTLRIRPEGRFTGTVLVRHNGEERGTPGDDSSIAAWTRVDVAGSYQLAGRVELFGRVENLLDADYQQVSGYGTPGLSGWLGLRLQY